MARSDYVYVLDRGGPPFAAYTVKYELHFDSKREVWYDGKVRVSRFRGGKLVTNEPLTEKY